MVEKIWSSTSGRPIDTSASSPKERALKVLHVEQPRCCAKDHARQGEGEPTVSNGEREKNENDNGANGLQEPGPRMMGGSHHEPMKTYFLQEFRERQCADCKRDQAREISSTQRIETQPLDVSGFDIGNDGDDKKCHRSSKARHLRNVHMHAPPSVVPCAGGAIHGRDPGTGSYRGAHRLGAVPVLCKMTTRPEFGVQQTPWCAGPSLRILPGFQARPGCQSQADGRALAARIGELTGSADIEQHPAPIGVCSAQDPFLPHFAVNSS